MQVSKKSLLKNNIITSKHSPLAMKCSTTYSNEKGSVEELKETGIYIQG